MLQEAELVGTSSSNTRIDPTMSAYEILNGAYNWNRYPLAPLECKAVVYKDGNTRSSWAFRGVDAFYLGPAQDHYCDHYYIPETRAYCISGLTELFLQHCQVPALTPHQYLRALPDELTNTLLKQIPLTKGDAYSNFLARRSTICSHHHLFQMNKGWAKLGSKMHVRQNEG